MLEYVRRLVALGYLDEAAIDIVQSNQDPPQVGIGLRSVADAQKKTNSDLYQPQLVGQRIASTTNTGPETVESGFGRSEQA